MKEGKVILVTGTSRGIGRFLAQAYIERGYSVVGCSRKEPDISSDNYRHFCLDVTDEKAVVNMFNAVRKEYSGLDVLINNAGITSYNHCMLTPYSTVENVFSVNTFGAFLFCREAAKLMSAKKFGRIVNISSLAVPLKIEGEAVYAASKAAVNMLTQVLAKELAPYNITCNAVGPTPVDTDMLKQFPEEKVEEILKLQAIKRMGRCEDVANIVDFFIKDESDFVTGQILYLGGILS